MLIPSCGKAAIPKGSHGRSAAGPVSDSPSTFWADSIISVEVNAFPGGPGVAAVTQGTQIYMAVTSGCCHRTVPTVMKSFWLNLVPCCRRQCWWGFSSWWLAGRRAKETRTHSAQRSDHLAAQAAGSSTDWRRMMCVEGAGRGWLGSQTNAFLSVFLGAWM